MNLFKSLLTVSGFTLLSRITGLMREVLIARAFGASGLTDAFNVAFRLPNLLRRLFAEGAFSQAFVPILAEYQQKNGTHETKHLVQATTIVLFWALLVVVLIGMLGAGGLIAFIASGFSQKGSLFDAAKVMTQIMFPYIGFMSFVAMSSAILNVYSKFTIPAFTPILLNFSFIGVALCFPNNIFALAWAVILGGALQLLIQLPALYKIGMLPKIAWRDLFSLQHFKHQGVQRILKQMLPAVLAVSVAQISLIINTNIASRLIEGSVSWLSYADRLMEFPTALLGVALSTILMPSLSKAAHQGSGSKAYSELLDWGLQLVLILSIPAALVLWFYSKPLAAALFHYGKFDAHDVSMTESALRCYGLGLIGLISVKILAPGFYAKQDIKTPVKIGIFILCITQAMNYFFVPMYQHAGLALSIGLAACLNALFLLLGLVFKKMYQTQASVKFWLLFALKIAIAALPLGMLANYLSLNLDWLGLQQHVWLRLTYLLSSLLLMMMIYLSVLYVLGVPLKSYIKKQLN